MKFSFDSALIARARQIILHQPSLEVLRREHAGQYSPLVVGIETELGGAAGTMGAAIGERPASTIHRNVRRCVRG